MSTDILTPPERDALVTLSTESVALTMVSQPIGCAPSMGSDGRRYQLAQRYRAEKLLSRKSDLWGIFCFVFKRCSGASFCCCKFPWRKCGYVLHACVVSK